MFLFIYLFLYKKVAIKCDVHKIEIGKFASDHKDGNIYITLLKFLRDVKNKISIR